MCQLMKTVLFLAFLLFASYSPAASKQDVLPVPPNAVPEIIASDMRFNGAPMQIVQFASLDSKETLKFYQDFFSKNAEKGKFAVTPANGGVMIGALMGERLVTIEIHGQPGEAANVLVSSIKPKLAQSPEKLARDIPRMPGTKVLQHQDSRDGGKTNRFIITQNKQSVEGNAMYLREHYIRSGWQRDKDDTIQSGEHRQLGFSKERRHLLVDVQKTDLDTTTVIYNEMTE